MDRHLQPLWSLLALVLVTCAPASAPPPVAPAPALHQASLEQEYRLEPGDLVTLRSYYHPQLDQQIRIRPDGRVSLLLLGDLRIAGQTVPEAAQAINAGYASVLQSPSISLVLDQASAQKVFLAGEVRVPSMQALEGPLTLLQAISLAGGFIASADRQQVLLLRSEDAEGGFRVHSIDVERILSNESPDVYLKSRDIVYVPKTRIANVNEFVDQYINRVIPQAIRAQFGLQYLLGNSGVRSN